MCYQSGKKFRVINPYQHEMLERARKKSINNTLFGRYDESISAYDKNISFDLKISGLYKY
jgi:hypothetical protein